MLDYWLQWMIGPLEAGLLLVVALLLAGNRLPALPQRTAIELEPLRRASPLSDLHDRRPPR